MRPTYGKESATQQEKRTAPLFGLAIRFVAFSVALTGRDVMPIEEMTNTDLAAAHSELMAKAWVARAANDIDTAQKYLRFIMPMTAEMARRMRAM
jgi:hypothetical protein